MWWQQQLVAPPTPSSLFAHHKNGWLPFAASAHFSMDEHGLQM